MKTPSNYRFRFLVFADLAVLPAVTAKAQVLSDSRDSFGSIAIATPAPTRPDVTRAERRQRGSTTISSTRSGLLSHRQRLCVWLASALIRRIILHRSGSKRAKGCSKRIGSDFRHRALATSTTTVMRSQGAFKEDTAATTAVNALACFRELSHAMISTFTARRGSSDEHACSLCRHFSRRMPGRTTAARLTIWYPGRYGARDALRMGNYSLLGYVGGNIALEFLYSGPHSLLPHAFKQCARSALLSGQIHVSSDRISSRRRDRRSSDNFRSRAH